MKASIAIPLLAGMMTGHSNRLDEHYVHLNKLYHYVLGLAEIQGMIIDDQE